MKIDLYDHQIEAVEKLENGKILVGGTGSGKSRTGLYYYFTKECGGKIKVNGIGEYILMTKPKDIYIITTAKKRDDQEWEEECKPFCLEKNGVKVTIDSWNNIKKYAHVKHAFFLFDEQRVVGSGTWAKTFIEITKHNRWILLTATPGDVWTDYIPVFVANGWYKNRTAFLKRHVIYNTFSKFPKIDRYVEVSRLHRLRKEVLIIMVYDKKTIPHNIPIIAPFDQKNFDTVMKGRWNIYKKEPIKDVAELCYVMRRVVNSDPGRAYILGMLFEKHPRIIVFYNFDYEREILLQLGKENNIPTTEWNGHNHEKIPETEQWMYIVQYAAGAEGWNCIDTNVIVFYSQNYSYKATVQAAGRTDRLNTPFTDLYYYYFTSNSLIDKSIRKAYNQKKNFNERQFIAS